MANQFTPEQEGFIIRLHSQARTHDEWLIIIRFGLLVLLETPRFLVELITLEATREIENRKVDSDMTISEKVGIIFDELNLKITVAP